MTAANTIYQKNKSKKNFVLAWADLMSAMHVFEYFGRKTVPKRMKQKKTQLRSSITKEIYLQLIEAKGVLVMTATAMANKKTGTDSITPYRLIAKELVSPVKLATTLVKPTKDILLAKKQTKTSSLFDQVENLRRSERLKKKTQSELDKNTCVIKQNSRLTRSSFKIAN